MDLEFYEPAEAAALMHCTEAWLRDGAANGRFPHVCWGKGKIVFTSEHIAEIARLREVPIHAGSSPQERLIGNRARRRLAAVGYQQTKAQQDATSISARTP